MTDVWIDRAIRSQAEDEFGRREYAVHAAERIQAGHTWDDSVVYGITGAWGSGKTSMVAMIAEEIRKNRQWRVARFSPWATGDVTGLLGDFFVSLAAALPADRAKQVREALGELAQLSAPAGHLVPYVGGLVSGATKRVGVALKGRRPWDDAFDRAMVAVRTLGTPVLVVADDVDRLQADELAALLKVVRLLGRFGGVHYLLAYDEATLFSTLARAGLVREDDGGAHRFMEKIVQYPLVVPDLSSFQLLRRVELGIGEALAAGHRQPLSGDRVADLHKQFVSLLPTPRAVDRYLAQLRHHLPLLPEDEAYDEDVIVLTLLRVAFPLLYARLPRWRVELTSGHTGQLDTSGPDLKMERFEVDRLLENVSLVLRDEAHTLLRDLFPALPTPGVRLTTTPRPRAVSDEHYFDRYFAMTVPDHDLADAAVAHALDRAAIGDGLELTALLRIEDQQRASLAIEKATNLSANVGFGDAPRLELLCLLLPRLNQWQETGAVFTSPRRAIMAWCVELLSGFSEAADITALAEAVAKAPSVDDRTELMYRAARRGDRPLPAPLSSVLRQVADEAAELLLVHIAQGDSAPEDEQIGWLITFLSETNMGGATRTRIVDAIASGLVTIADVAARFISIDRDPSTGTPRLTHRRNQEFAALVPHTDDPWYDEPMNHDVDSEDVSWANRRAAAAGRFPRPEHPQI